MISCSNPDCGHKYRGSFCPVCGHTEDDYYRLGEDNAGNRREQFADDEEKERDA